MTILARPRQCHCRLLAGGHRQQAGFTLIELMVVMVIMAALAGLLTLSLGGNPAKEVQREARRLQQLLVLADDEARMQGQWLGLAADSQGSDHYQFLRFDPGQQGWQAMDERGFGRHQLPAGMALTVIRQDQRADDEQQQRLALLQQQLASDGFSPLQLVFLNSGDSTPARLLLSHEQLDSPRQLVVDGIGGVYLQP